MNAAEITDKLGLHSLRQRAWVSPSVEYTLLLPQQRLTKPPQTVHPIHLRYFRRRSLRGSGMVEQLSPQGRSQLRAVKERDGKRQVF